MTQTPHRVGGQEISRRLVFRAGLGAAGVTAVSGVAGSQPAFAQDASPVPAPPSATPVAGETAVELGEIGTITVYPARQILTMNDAQPTAEVVAVADGRILSVGTMASIQPWLDRYPHEIDETFQDKILMPGFIDPHLHLIIGGTLLSSPYIGHFPLPQPGGGSKPGVKDKAEAIARMKQADIALTDPEAELFIYGWDEPFQGELTKADLDQVSATRPMAVMAYSWHTTYANTAMLAKRGVTRDTDVFGVVKDADGEPTGVFHETAAAEMIIGPISKTWYQPEHAKEAVGYSAGVAHGNGVTTTADMFFGAVDLELEYSVTRALVDEPGFPVRIQAVYDGATAVRQHGDQAAAFVTGLRQRNDDRLFFDHIKFFADGGFNDIAGETGWPGAIDGQQGLWNLPPGITPDQLWTVMLQFWQAGIDIHIHVTADLGLDMVIGNLARLQEAKPRFDHRFTVEHMGIAFPHQLRRLAALGGLVSNNIYFLYYRGERYAEMGYGPDRSAHASPLGSVTRAGIPFAVHSDMTIAPCIPLQAVWIAVNRFGQSGAVLMPEERVSLDLALKAITINAAYVLRLDHLAGSIEVGKWADFAVLEQSPYDVDPTAIRDIAIWGTVLGGVKLPREEAATGG